MVVAGYGIRETARTIGVLHQTLMLRAKREGWYRPDKQVEDMPPPPPPKPPKAPPSVGPFGEGVPPPDPGALADDIAYYRALVRWATEGVATLARSVPNVQMWLVEKLPNAIKVLSSIQAGPPPDAVDLLAQFEERLAKVRRPPSRPADKGESPADREDGGA
jgi:hypothetical protein